MEINGITAYTTARERLGYSGRSQHRHHCFRWALPRHRQWYGQGRRSRYLESVKKTQSYAHIAPGDAHADHFGGAHYLVRQTGLKVYATRVEASVMAAPILEPLYLFSGAQPPRELQHKFLLAKPCPADAILAGNEQALDDIPVQVIALPGHSTEQVGIAFGETLFVGDAFLIPEILDKHRIPFYTDVQAGLMTLTTLKTRAASFKQIVAGHGEISTSTGQANSAIDYMVARLEDILDQVRIALDDGAARTDADILRAVSTALGAEIATLSQYVLYNTTVQSTLSTLYTRNEIAPVFRENQLLWRRLQ